jgi:hypothetical protein
MRTSELQTVSVSDGEEMVKRVFAIAKLLAKGKSTKNNKAKTPQEKREKTQDAKPDVSS